MTGPGEKHRHFLEEMAVVFEGFGIAPATGRIFAWLLICDPSQQSPTQIGDVVGISKGAVSSSMKMLLAARWVERLKEPGHRGTFYRVRPGVWEHVFEAEFSALARMRQIAEHGLELLKDADPAVRRRLEEMRTVYRFMEGELPCLIERMRREMK